MNEVIVKNQKAEEFKVGDLFIDNTSGEVYLLSNVSNIYKDPKYVAICINDGLPWNPNSKETNEAVDGLTFLGRFAKIKITLE